MCTGIKSGVFFTRFDSELTQIDVEIKNSYLSNTTKLMLDSLLQDFTMEAMYICISLKLGVPETPF